MVKYKKLEMLTMKDNFMFGAVMTDPENCKPFLEMALGIPIGKLTVNLEKKPDLSSGVQRCTSGR